MSSHGSDSLDEQGDTLYPPTVKTVIGRTGRFHVITNGVTAHKLYLDDAQVRSLIKTLNALPMGTEYDRTT